MVLGHTPGSKRHSQNGSSSSRYVRSNTSTISATGRFIRRTENLSALRISKRQINDRLINKDHIESLTTAERNEMGAIRNHLLETIPNVDDVPSDDWEMDMGDMLNGEAALDVSHAGGEFKAIVNLAEEFLNSSTGNHRSRDYRTRRDRTELRHRAFSAQLPALKAAYMEWMFGLRDRGLSAEYELPADAKLQGTFEILAVD
ncbi:hypothetical protein BJ912DRAFT_827714, partial [Pholiota molesta]